MAAREDPVADVHAVSPVPGGCVAQGQGGVCLAHIKGADVEGECAAILRKSDCGGSHGAGREAGCAPRTAAAVGSAGRCQSASDVQAAGGAHHRPAAVAAAVHRERAARADFQFAAVDDRASGETIVGGIQRESAFALFGQRSRAGNGRSEGDVVAVGVERAAV